MVNEADLATLPPGVPLPLVHDRELARRLSGAPALLMLDVDGTLSPLAPRPEDAYVPDATRAAIAALVAAPATHVALVSGRAAADALRMVAVDGLWAVGNHGFETWAPDGTVSVDPRVAPWTDALREAAHALTVAAADVAGARLEDKRLTLSLHYRLVEPGGIAPLLAAAEREAGARGLALTHGKMVVELRPPVRVDKGTASVALAQRLGAIGPGAALLFAGDDVTDEDGFRALRAAAPGAVTVRVGAVPEAGSHAEFVVPTLAAMRELLEWAGALRRGG